VKRFAPEGQTDDSSPPSLALLTPGVPIDVGGLPARLLSPAVTEAVPPLVLYLHRGDFIPQPTSPPPLVARLLAAAGAAVVTLRDPLAPAAHSPAALDIAYAALQWMQRHKASLASERSPMVVAGEHTGGNLAAALAMKARDLATPPLAGQILLSPTLDPSPGTATLTSQRVDGLPRALVVTSDSDPWRDQTLAYTQQLRAAGVGVRERVLDAGQSWPAGLNVDDTDAPWITAVCIAFEQFFRSLAPAPDLTPTRAAVR
jgi:acetyl esterase